LRRGAELAGSNKYIKKVSDVFDLHFRAEFLKVVN
jgi:hypothetical protein